MAYEDWKKCPVDGTWFFHASETYPLGRPHGSLYCSVDCATQARSPEATRKRDSEPYGAFYVPRVDGTLGTKFERFNGGPVVDHDGNLVTSPADFKGGSRFKVDVEEES